MRKPVKAKRILLWSVGTVLFLTLILAVHIIWVTWPSDEYHAEMQLGRIDFKDTLTTEAAATAVSVMKGIDGVQIVKLNKDRTNLVYSITTGAQSLSTVAAQYKASIPFACEPFIPSVSELANGCPVLNKKSLMYRFTIFLHNAFS